MDPYSMACRRFQDNLARSGNYTNITLDYMMQQLHFSRPDHFPASCPYVPSSEELWHEQQGGVGGCGGGHGDDDDDE